MKLIIGKPANLSNRKWERFTTSNCCRCCFFHGVLATVLFFEVTAVSFFFFFSGQFQRDVAGLFRHGLARIMYVLFGEKWK